MRTGRIVGSAFVALRRNPTRAALTTLGIVIGVAAVIAMVEIGQGSAIAIQRTVGAMGANNLMVFPGMAASAGVSFGAGSSLTLTPDDAAAIMNEVESITTAAPVVRVKGQVVAGSRNWVPQNIYGTTPAFLTVRNWTELDEGDMFSDRDVRSANKVCVLGKTLVHELFQDESPIGRELRIQNVTFKVIGVLSRKGANMMGQDQDDIVLAPWSAIKFRIAGSTTSQTTTSTSTSSSTTTSNSSLYPSAKVELYPQPSDTQATDQPVLTRFVNIDQIVTAAKSPELIPAAMQEITQLLQQRHRIRDDEPDDFTVHDMTEITKAVTKTSGLMRTLLLFVALISLVVGGVGIMNIMLVSVTERTKEIGLRMAVGARASDILRQFLVEAVVLCLIGGALGILLGRGASLLVTLLLGWPIATSITAIAVAVLTSASVGVVFGYYPAWKASRLDPIEALRYE